MTFKDLTFKKKVEHIWEYYKWLILGVIFVTFVGGSMVYAMAIKPKTVNYAGIAVYGTHLPMENIDKLTNEINQSLGLSEPNSVTVTNYFFQEGDDLFNVDVERKFITYLYSLETHVITAMESDMKTFIESEYVAPLSDYLTQEELDTLNKEGRVIYMTDPLDGKEKPFAINIDNSRIFDEFQVFEGEEQSSYIGIVPVKDYDENIKAVVREIIEES